MKYICEIEDQTVQPVLSVRTRTSVANLPKIIGDTYGTIMGYLIELDESPSGAPFVAYYNMDMDNLDVEIGMPIGHPLSGSDPVQPSGKPAGKYASCAHIGPYQEMGPAYEALTEYITKQGYTPSGIVYEEYLNSPEEVPESELKTRISFLLT